MFFKPYWEKYVQYDSFNMFNFSLSPLASFPLPTNMNMLFSILKRLALTSLCFSVVAFLSFRSLPVNPCYPQNIVLFPLNSCVIWPHCAPQRGLLKVISDLPHVLQVYFWSSPSCNPLHNVTPVNTTWTFLSPLSPLPHSGPPLSLLRWLPCLFTLTVLSVHTSLPRLAGGLAQVT